MNCDKWINELNLQVPPPVLIVCKMQKRNVGQSLSYFNSSIISCTERGTTTRLKASMSFYHFMC